MLDPRRRASHSLSDESIAGLVMGCALCLLGLWYGVFLFWGPALPVSHDELNFLFEALRLPAQGRLTHYAHAPFFYELVALVEGVWYVALRAAGQVSSSQEFLVTLLLNQDAHLRVLRGMVALGSLGLVWQIYRFGRLFSDPVPAALAAFLSAGNFTLIAMTSMAKEDVFYWLFVFLAMERAWNAVVDGGRRDAVIAGVSIGLATSSKFFGVFSGVCAALPQLKTFPVIEKDSWRISFTIAAFAALSLLVTFPFLLTDTTAVLNSVRDVQSIYSSLGLKWTLGAYLFHHLPNLLGWPIVLMGTFEFVWRWLREPKGPILLSLVPMIGFLFVSLRRGFSLAYYSMPMAILLIVLAVSAVARIATPRWRNPALALIVIVFASNNAFFLGTLKYGILLTGPDTRLLAESALRSKARPGERVLVNQAVLGENVFGPPLLSAENPAGHGPFTMARSKADSRRSGVRYALTILDYSQDIPSDAGARFDWLVIGRRGVSSTVEFGTDAVTPIGAATIPPGFNLVESVRAYPEMHSHFYPYPTTLDYQALRGISLASLWDKGAMGMSFDIYERVGR